MQDGSVWSTGENYFGQLGSVPKSVRTTFHMTISSGVQAMSAGMQHSIVLKQDGSVWTSGNNNMGELGDGSRSDRYEFTKVISGGVKL